MKPPQADPAPTSRSKTLTLATAAILLCAVAAGVAWFVAGRSHESAATKPAWLVIASTRDGYSDEGYGAEPVAYSVRPDGSRLTALLGDEHQLAPISVSADGSAIAYDARENPQTLYVSGADGTALRRVVHFKHQTVESAVLSPDGKQIAATLPDPNSRPRLLIAGTDGRRLWEGQGADADWSRDGRKLVFATGRGCAIATEPFDRAPIHVRRLCGVPKWSPDGKRFVFETRGGCEVVTAPQSDRLERWLQELQGEPTVFLPGRCQSPQWSPDGRWIAYATTGCPYCESEKVVRAARKNVGMWVIGPNGEGRHRIGPADEYSGAAHSWSPDGERLAFTDASRLFVAQVPDRAKRLRVRISPEYESESAPFWSSDGRELTLAAQEGDDPTQIWTLRRDGSGLRRLTSAGENALVGKAALAPRAAPATPLPWSERVQGPRTLETRRPIGMLAADGGRVAYEAGTTRTDCEHVSIWAPTRRTLVRSRLATPCEHDEPSVYELALAGPLVGWSTLNGCSPSNCEVVAEAATLPRLRPSLVGEDDSSDGSDEGGALTRFGFAGHGNVFVDYNGVRVDTGGGTIRRCRLHRDGLVRSVSGHLIAVHARTSVAVLDDHCSLVRVFPFAKGEVKRTVLDRQRLVLSRSGSIEAYDVETGRLVARRALPAGYKLNDAAGGIAVLLRGRSILLLRLADGRTVTFMPCRGPVHADIETVGLYYSYATFQRGGRLVLVPRSELERRLDAGHSDKPRCLRSAELFPTGSGPISVAVGDLSRDGKPDLVTANDSGTVSVLVRARNSFETRRDYRLGGLPFDVAVADLDGDGDLDVAVALAAANAVAVLLNRGDGTLGAPHRYHAGHDASTLTLGDLNADRKPDIVVWGGTEGRVTILLNRADATFPKAERVGGGSTTFAPMIADLTRDGRPDLLVGRLEHGDLGPVTVTVLAGAGDGTFAAGPKSSAEEYTGTGAVADLNGNGRPDLAMLVDCGVSIMFDKGRGGFGPPRELPKRDDCVEAIGKGDLNGDGRIDLVTVATPSGFPASLRVLLNRGHGRFTAAGTYEAGPSSDSAGNLTIHKVAVHDLDGDGKADIAYASGFGNSVAVLTNTLGVCHVHGLRGRTLAEARALLARAGCRIGRISRVSSSRVPKGSVVTPEPRFGAFWPNGPAVDLVVSLGRKR